MEEKEQKGRRLLRNGVWTVMSLPPSDNNALNNALSIIKEERDDAPVARVVIHNIIGKFIKKTESTDKQG